MIHPSPSAKRETENVKLNILILIDSSSSFKINCVKVNSNCGEFDFLFHLQKFSEENKQFFFTLSGVFRVV